MRLFKISLAFQMAIATVFGILFGLFLGDLCDVFAYASAYIKLLKVTAIPYLIGAIIMERAGASLVNTKTWYLLLV